MTTYNNTSKMTCPRVNILYTKTTHHGSGDAHHMQLGTHTYTTAHRLTPYPTFTPPFIQIHHNTMHHPSTVTGQQAIHHTLDRQHGSPHATVRYVGCGKVRTIMTMML